MSHLKTSFRTALMVQLSRKSRVPRLWFTGSFDVLRLVSFVASSSALSDMLGASYPSSSFPLEEVSSQEGMDQ